MEKIIQINKPLTESELELRSIKEILKAKNIISDAELNNKKNELKNK